MLCSRVLRHADIGWACRQMFYICHRLREVAVDVGCACSESMFVNIIAGLLDCMGVRCYFDFASQESCRGATSAEE